VTNSDVRPPGIQPDGKATTSEQGRHIVIKEESPNTSPANLGLNHTEPIPVIIDIPQVEGDAGSRSQR
jgi:hypothetical protein